MAIDTTTGSHAAKPIRDFLTGFLPVEKTIADPETCVLSYDILNWTFTPGQPPPCPNAVYGSLTIARQQDDDAVVYQIHQRTQIGGQPNIFTAEVTCNVDDTLKSWTLHTYREDEEGKPVPISELMERWVNADGHVQSVDGAYEYRATRPVYSHWTVPHLLLCNKLSFPCEFDMIQDLSLFRPQQTLFENGMSALDAGTFKTYAQTGEGILPIHYLLDDHNRPQLITFGLIAWALTDIS